KFNYLLASPYIIPGLAVKKNLLGGYFLYINYRVHYKHFNSFYKFTIGYFKGLKNINISLLF
ncbi:hypothetical protein FOXB_15842, partial [Fusarium oxysporum f. sp. conglutinans Fo5176]